MPKRRASASCKGSRNTEGRPCRPKKRIRPLNVFEKEQETASTSKSAKKLQNRMVDVEIDAKFGYRIINFVAVFSAISNHVKCSTCGGKVEFLESSIRGLGFKILITCNACEPRGVFSSPLIGGNAYDINRRIAFAMRLLGQGLAGIEKFCAKAVWEKIREKAGEEEKMLTLQAATCKKLNGLSVSGDGTWKKLGSSTLYGVCTVIGHYSKKVLDVVIKSSYCKACAHWEKQKDTEEYAEWKKTHDAKCFANHTGSARKMEVDAIVDIFQRSLEVHGIRYLFYIGDGDSKTFAAILKSKPYGDVLVQKKELEILGGYNQNCNESVNSVTWKIASKISSESAEVVEIAAYIACSTFNEGAMAYLNVMQVLNLKIGDKAQQWSVYADQQCVNAADLQAQESTRKARSARRLERFAAEDILADAEGLQYGAGTAE
ncbi:uncharacterized protein LOC112458805 isoform X2 [Temnothorax curvispinosus]|uniref:Uncharacterized protein LOC112458805 isoform X2 n=1 Tax=Temnothorax curvispinosus TaxID=300111 RepID=A0A6J1Q817_9HYME|nr:uncharacterized protein LOC112458805 isoform X2 [Temnothorax curvispinosus]